MYASNFTVDANGHGGNHRTAQVVELVRSTGLEIRDTKMVRAANRYIEGLWGLNFVARNGVRLAGEHGYYPSPWQLPGLGRHYRAFQHAFADHKGKKLLIWESTNNYAPPYLAREAGFKIMAVPQNLESLGQGGPPYTRRALPKSLKREISYLAKADAVFCISREEQWLLKLWGVDADYLPTYPPEPVLLSLLKVRERRDRSAKMRFLILGTVHNPPTLEGMIDQLGWLKKIGGEMDFEVDIAGYGTEQLERYCDDPALTLRGTVSTSVLGELLTNARAVLIHQRAAVGALTRIPEMLVAGIPVIANDVACRSAHEYEGVHCYSNPRELAALMNRRLDTPPVLARPVEAERRFAARLGSLAP